MKLAKWRNELFLALRAVASGARVAEEKARRMSASDAYCFGKGGAPFCDFGWGRQWLRGLRRFSEMEWKSKKVICSRAFVAKSFVLQNFWCNCENYSKDFACVYQTNDFFVNERNGASWRKKQSDCRGMQRCCAIDVKKLFSAMKNEWSNCFMNERARQEQMWDTKSVTPW